MKNAILRSLALFVLALVVACGGGAVNQDNYDKIKTGMTLKEVEDILGKHSKGDGGAVEAGGLKLGGGGYTWEDGDKSISITILNDKVATKTKKGF